MKYNRLTERRKRPLTMSMWTSDGESLKFHNRLAKLEDKIENGELISTVQSKQNEQEIAFFAKHDVKVCKEVVKECLQVLRDIRIARICDDYQWGWNKGIDQAIKRIAERYNIDEEERKDD